MDILVTILYDKFKKGRQVYRLEQSLDFIAWSRRIRIYKGLKTDLVSLPWMLRLVASPTGRWARGAIFHDFLYRTHYVSRKEADQVFYKVMREDNVPTWKAKPAYYLIRWFGGYRYNKYKETIDNYRKYGYVENLSR